MADNQLHEIQEAEEIACACRFSWDFPWDTVRRYLKECCLEEFLDAMARECPFSVSDFVQDREADFREFIEGGGLYV